MFVKSLANAPLSNAHPRAARLGSPAGEPGRADHPCHLVGSLGEATWQEEAEKGLRPLPMGPFLEVPFTITKTLMVVNQSIMTNG